MKRLFAFFLVLLCAGNVFSLSYPYYRTDVTVDIGARHRVEENFVARFEYPSHGIERFIPLKFADVRARVSEVECSEPHDDRVEDGFKVIRIGDEDELVSGDQEYSLSYNYNTGKIPVEGGEGDVFLFNLLGTENEAPVERFDFNVFIPLNGISAGEVGITLFRGLYGDRAQFVDYSSQIQTIDGVDFLVVSGSAFSFAIGEGVTIRLDLPEGYFRVVDRSAVVKAAICGTGFFLLFLSLVAWRRFGVDEPAVVTARFTPPDGLSPMYVGYINDGAVGGRDLSAMLFYWADKGFIRIEETEKGIYRAVKLVSKLDGAEIAEEALFNGIFNKTGDGEIADLSKTALVSISGTINSCKQYVAGYFTGKRALTEEKSTTRSKFYTVVSAVPLLLFSVFTSVYNYDLGLMIFAGYVSVFTTIVSSVLIGNAVRLLEAHRGSVFMAVLCVAPYAAAAGLFGLFFSFVDYRFLICCTALSAGIMFVSKFISKKSAYGRRITDEVAGFRDFIDKVEMDQLKALIDDDPEFYYHVLCYAIVLGLEKKWADKFRFASVPAPEWYSGMGAFDVAVLSGMARGMQNAVNAAAAARNAGHSIGGLASGGGGGGFSGGGMGGGGSRSW